MCTGGGSPTCGCAQSPSCQSSAAAGCTAPGRRAVGAKVGGPLSEPGHAVAMSARLCEATPALQPSPDARQLNNAWFDQKSLLKREVFGLKSLKSPESVSEEVKVGNIQTVTPGEH